MSEKSGSTGIDSFKDPANWAAVVATIFAGILYWEADSSGTLAVILGGLIPFSLIAVNLLGFRLSQRYKYWPTHLKYTFFALFVALLADRIWLYEGGPPRLSESASVAYIIVMIFSIIGSLAFIVDRQYKRDEEYMARIEALEEAEQRSGVKGFEQLLAAVEEKDGNALAAAGNLLSLKTDRGMELLNSFLENSDNEVYLFIPEDSTVYLSEVKEKIVSENYLERIKGKRYDPFWFMQGIVTIMKTDEHPDHEVDVIGCYFYKPRTSEDEEMAEEGIYIDFTGSERRSDRCQSVNAYFSLMRELEYTNHPYRLSKIFRIEEGREGGHEWVEPEGEEVVGWSAEDNTDVIDWDRY